MKTECFVFKFSFLLAFILLLQFHAHAETLDSETSDTNKFDWILGDWETINSVDEKQHYEQWVKISDIEYNGYGFSLVNNDTVFEEHMALVKFDEVWAFIAIDVNTQPTIFKITKLDELAFVSENLKNEFPKKISYKIEDNMLVARISDDNSEITFSYKSKQQIEYEEHKKNSGRAAAIAIVAICALLMIRYFNRKQ
ncbi:MAG: hypothetical protein HOD63_14150 [Bacteroidetes bacterium]|jgi:hypothetical protein|nr:hypothetical protein [Bacteroidota bacterium]MBT5529379.1 hypothetical protein [Cytophagia bacterium]MBT3935439.1 hypothetical protein [Bacteroidota bacterium]MBT4339730.1 hypothetical protein [Bacteroidota bacterium]MBT5989324.1 hypothetical protein [Bacteroidota bacterium]